jgi:molecular chaperone GrpE (heat shock protein)
MKKKIRKNKSKFKKDNKETINETEEVTQKNDNETISPELDILKEQLADAEDSKLRALAEVENMRRRMEKEKQDMVLLI